MSRGGGILPEERDPGRAPALQKFASQRDGVNTGAMPVRAAVRGFFVLVMRRHQLIRFAVRLIRIMGAPFWICG
jgi:hypothetical protein